MLKKIIKRVARQPLSCIAVCLFAAVLSFSLCFLHHSLEKERVSFEETCNSIPVRYKITELDGSKFEGEGGIEKWALNQFLLKKGDFYDLAGELHIRLDFKGVVKPKDETGEPTPTNPVIGISSIDAAEELSESRGTRIRWYEGYDESTLSEKEYFCLVPEDFEGGDEFEIVFTGRNNFTLEREGDIINGELILTDHYVQHTAKFTVVGRYTDEGNKNIYCPYKTMVSLFDKVELAKEEYVGYLGGTLKNSADVEKLREVRARWFAEPNPTGEQTPWADGGAIEYYVYALDIEDALLRDLEINMKNSIFLNKFASVVVFILTACAGFMTGFLIIRSRKREIVLRRAMGTSNRSTFFEFLLEQLACAAVGILIGGAYSLWQPAWQLLTFALIYCIGLCIALTVFMRKNLLTTIKEDE